MALMRTQFSRLLRDETGVTAIEYGLVASLISLTIIGSLTYFGSRVNGFIASAANAITGF